jgi:hypothetical protein
VVPLDKEAGAPLRGVVGGVEDPTVPGGAWVDAVSEGDALDHRDAEAAAPRLFIPPAIARVCQLIEPVFR